MIEITNKIKFLEDYSKGDVKFTYVFEIFLNYGKRDLLKILGKYIYDNLDYLLFKK